MLNVLFHFLQSTMATRNDVENEDVEMVDVNIANTPRTMISSTVKRRSMTFNDKDDVDSKRFKTVFGW